VLKARPEFLNDWKAKLWARFFCLSVYITMYLNDHQRDEFYSSLGLNTTQFNQHVILETNKSTERIFPAVPDVNHPEFFKKMDLLVKYNGQIAAIGKMDIPEPLKVVMRLPLIERMVAEIFQIFIMKPIDCGSYDLEAQQAQLSY